jgi:uncharacterized DUF497 family protein
MCTSVARWCYGGWGAGGISVEEIHQLVRNASVTVRNPRSDPPDERRLMTGRTDGGRALTLVVERTSDPRPG